MPEGTPPKLNEKPSFRFNPQLWNLGGASTASATGNSDDIGFVRAILDDLPKYLSFDPRRVYAAGFSNGAACASAWLWRWGNGLRPSVRLRVTRT